MRYALIRVSGDFLMQVIREGGIHGLPIGNPLPSDVKIVDAMMDFTSASTLILKLATNSKTELFGVRDGGLIDEIELIYQANTPAVFP